MADKGDRRISRTTDRRPRRPAPAGSPPPAARPGPMTCKDAIAVLAEFIESSLSPEALLQLEEHLRGCEPCRAYVNTYRKTRGLASRAATAEMPEEMRERLRAFLLSHLGGDRR